MPLVVHFKRPAGWQATINIHYWNTSPADPATTWPGIAMTAEANDWFVYTFPTAQAASIVFNDGAGRQTGVCGGRATAGSIPTTPGTRSTPSDRRFR